MWELINAVTGDKRAGTGYLVIPQGAGKPVAVIKGDSKTDTVAGVPSVTVRWAKTLARLRATIDGLA